MGRERPAAGQATAGLERSGGAAPPDGGSGDPSLDTTRLRDGTGLRADMILPSASVEVTGAGVFWPAEGDPLAATLEEASPHRPVWVTIALP